MLIILNYFLSTHRESYAKEIIPLDSIGKPCIPESMHERILQALHEKNHSGGNALASVVSQRFFFPRLVSICRDFVFRCAPCQKLAKRKPQKHTYGFDIVGSPGEKICLDFVGPLRRTKKGNTSLLTVVDTYTDGSTPGP